MPRSFRACVLLALAVTAGGFAGCVSDAQQRVDTIRDRIQKAISDEAQCIDTLAATPAGQVVYGKSPRDVRSPSLRMMSNTDKATDVEIANVLEYHTELQQCRQILLRAIAQYQPALLEIRLDYYSKNDALFLRLVKKEITWGELVGGVSANFRESAQRSTAALNELNRQNQYALQQAAARQQAAAAALLQWSSQQQMINQTQNYQQQLLNQQIFNSSRLMQTNCTTLGNTVNCISR